MPNYQDGKIYKITSDLTDQVYVGSTTNKLSRRMTNHRTNSGTGTSKLYTLMRELGAKNFKILLVSKFPCTSKEELNAEEERVRLETKDETELLNMKRCFMTEADTKEMHRQYYLNNAEKSAERCKKYYQNNQEKVAENAKKYYQNNPEKFAGYAKKYQVNNPEKIAEYSRKYYQNNTEKIAAKARNYRLNNPDKFPKKVSECLSEEEPAV